MDIYTAISTRRTVRDFDGRPVEPDIIERIIGAGLKAPSNDHMRNWEFVIVSDKKVRAELLSNIPGILPSKESEINTMMDNWGLTDTDARNMLLDSYPKQYTMLYNAGCLILPFFYSEDDVLHPETLVTLSPFASIWCCIENILLAAASEGVFGVTRIPQLVDEQAHIRKIIGCPDHYVLPCYVALGYPKKDAYLNVQKKVSVKDKTHIDKW